MNASSLRYMQVKERLIEHIAALKPHERLPSRTALSESYNAARTTIERAISELIGEGLLYARDGSGTYVAEGVRGTVRQERVGTCNWGLLVPDILHYIYPGIVRGVGDVASDHDVNLMICNTDNSYEKQTRHINKLIDSGVHGLIVVPAIYGTVDLQPFYRLKESGIPLVFCHRMIEGIQAPRVISNNFYAGYIATKHLLAAGFTKIGFISRPVYSASSERYQGYVCALTEAGIPLRPEWVVFESSFETDGEGYFSALRMLRGEDRPDGVFCFNDGIAKGAGDAAAELGLAVGTDIGVVGCDNTNICETMSPKLTSVKFQTYETGAEAARILLAGAAQISQTLVLQPELIVRESTRNLNG
ncbi:GntR family transcriptional regulator [Paenibacillus hamazuiensis]|uniref:GntR family transcriptional regulator n=1 Tax=Paenibacillus hamazuiensis TaxID=2936508 RepID=UPI00200CC5B8|nr:GntR family transcriptional regulator [Paenibacillus hamazuiensis]